VKALPYPFHTKEQFAAVQSNPIGKEWNTGDIFRKLITPAVTTTVNNLLFLVPVLLVLLFHYFPCLFSMFLSHKFFSLNKAGGNIEPLQSFMGVGPTKPPSYKQHNNKNKGKPKNLSSLK
jgi:hypothetical protein